jgi:hypothetical protein
VAASKDPPYLISSEYLFFYLTTKSHLTEASRVQIAFSDLEAVDWLESNRQQSPGNITQHV